MLGAETRLGSILATLVGNAGGNPARAVYETLLDGSAPCDDAALLIVQFSQSARNVNAPALGRPATKQWRFHAGDARAAHVMRQEIGAYLEQIAGTSEDVSNSELILGELLANTVEHAPGLVELSIAWTDEHALLTVCDKGPGVTTLRDTLPADALHEGSRGLFLVHNLSLGVTVSPSPSGGAEIAVLLPLKPLPAAERANVVSAIAERRRRVL